MNTTRLDRGDVQLCYIHAIHKLGPSNMHIFRASHNLLMIFMQMIRLLIWNNEKENKVRMTSWGPKDMAIKAKQEERDKQETSKGARDQQFSVMRLK